MLKVQLLSSNAKAPSRATSGSVGYDLYAAKPGVLHPGSCDIVDIDIAVQLPPNCYGRIAPRSSLALKMLQVGAGVIDPDYTGPVKVVLFNHGQNIFRIKVGDCIAQLVLESCVTPDVEVVDTVAPTTRGCGSFGSTNGKQ